MAVVPSLSPQGLKPDPNPGWFSAAILLTFGASLVALGYVTFGEHSVQQSLALPVVGAGFILIGLNQVWITLKKRRNRRTS